MRECSCVPPLLVENVSHVPQPRGVRKRLFLRGAKKRRSEFLFRTQYLQQFQRFRIQSVSGFGSFSENGEEKERRSEFSFKNSEPSSRSNVAVPGRFPH